MSDPHFLVADIGGTNARFAAYRGDSRISSATCRTAECDDLHALARSFVETMPRPPDIVVAAVAGPVRDNAVRLTNVDRVLSGDALKSATGAAHAWVINDFTAAAWATRDLRRRDVKAVAGSPDPQPGTRVIVGPGTGLGVSALVFDGHDYRCVAGEGGHAGIGPQDAFEISIFNALYDDRPDVFFGHPLQIEAEAILSGTGLPLLYHAICKVEGRKSGAIDAAGIFSGARSGTDPVAGRTVRIFKTHLAQFCGDLGLTFGADSGIYVVGGIAQKNPWLFDAAFAASLTAGGRFTDLRRTLNLYLVQLPDLGIVGAHNLARDHLRRILRA